MPTSKRGFASFTPEKLFDVSSRGGSKKTRKGFGVLTPEEQSQNGSRASKIRWAKVRAERARQEEQ